MSIDADEFDPTRALDDWRAPQEHGLPDLDLLDVIGRARRASLDPQGVARLQRRGFDMNEIEDLEVKPARALAMSEAQPETPLHEPSPRLLERWRTGCWSAAARRVLIGRTERRVGGDGPDAERHVPHWLLAAWAPQDGTPPHVSRWPEHVLLVAAQNSLMAAEQLLAFVPEEALVWLGPLDIDWSLAAEVLLHHEPTLSPSLAQVLRDFSAIERLALSKRIQNAYEPAAQGQPLRRKKSEL